MSDIESLLEGYTHRIEIPILWGYMDAMQHVNNTVYFRFFESARLSYFNALDNIEEEDKSWKSLILHSTDCRFRIPLTYPNTVTVGIRVTEMYVDRLKMYHLMVSHQHKRVAAEGGAIVVGYNLQTLAKAPLDARFRQWVIDLDQPEVFS